MRLVLREYYLNQEQTVGVPKIWVDENDGMVTFHFKETMYLVCRMSDIMIAKDVSPKAYCRSHPNPNKHYWCCHSHSQETE